MKSIKFIKLIAVISALLTALMIVMPLILQKALKIPDIPAASVGIIGGADGPTYVFVTNGFNFIFNPASAAICAAVAIVSTSYIVIRKVRG